MTIRKRSAVMGFIVALLLILYGAAKYNSSYLVEYVVERTLIQKAPAGTDPVEIQEKLQELLDAAPGRPARLEMLFRISGYLEKVQELSPQALKELLEAESTDVFIR
jgi:hypothetical protein